MKFFFLSFFIAAVVCASCMVGLVPEEQKLAEFTTNNLDFSMTVQYSAPYDFVLGVPKSETGPLNFRGEMVLRQSTGVVARIPVSSEDIHPCNWLHSAPDLSSYILTWSHTNHGEILDDVLAGC